MVSGECVMGPGPTSAGRHDPVRATIVAIVSVRRTDQRQPGEEPPRRFVPRDVLIQAARTAPRIDAERFRADIDALIDPYCLSGEGTEPRNEERGR